MLLAKNNLQNTGYTPLVAAASKGQMEAVSLLLDRGADVEVICTVKFGVVSHFHLSTVLLMLRLSILTTEWRHSSSCRHQAGARKGYISAAREGSKY